MRLQQLPNALRQLEAESRLRRRARLDSPQGVQAVIDGASYITFASNDYLGLADHPALVAAVQLGLERWGVGAGASHLVTGHFAAHEEAERQLAEFVGSEAALLFGSGYAANLAAITSLAGRGDAIFADKLNHASLNDGCLLSRAEFKRFRHNDLEHLEQLLRDTPAAGRLIAVDAVYSMDGDQAPLPELLALAERYDAWLYVDDAHGFGVLGEGRGSLAQHGLNSERLVYMATLGKAAGLTGAFVAGSRELCAWLLNRGRSYIYSTAQPPALAAAIPASLRLIREGDARRARLAELVALCHQKLAGSDFQATASHTPIQPLIIGGDAETLAWSSALRERGYWVPAIRPPTVPEGSARLRLSLSAAHEPEQVSGLLDALLTR